VCSLGICEPAVFFIVYCIILYFYYLCCEDELYCFIIITLKKVLDIGQDPRQDQGQEGYKCSPPSICSGIIRAS